MDHRSAVLPLFNPIFATYRDAAFAVHGMNRVHL
ncbi:Uncharacterised protein [Vibrio cholerae]|nr:Uncharacterised protein [Vibrio cholerae]